LISKEMQGRSVGGQPAPMSTGMGGADTHALNARINELNMEVRRLESEINQSLIVMKKEIATLRQEECAFMTKHLCGYSCASSSKPNAAAYAQKEGIIRQNMLPKRDPAERMARVGQGYSHMLQMVDSAQFGYESHTRTTALKVPAKNMRQSIEELNPATQQQNNIRLQSKYPQQPPQKQRPLTANTANQRR
jgi:hypothetical protein